MGYIRICPACDAVVDAAQARGRFARCPECGSVLAGPVADVPRTKAERSKVLASPDYTAAAKGVRRPIPGTW